MSVDTVKRAAPPGEDADASGAGLERRGRDDELGERGHLTIADRVVEKVAAQAVSEVDAATGTPRRVLGQTIGRPKADSRARTSAHVDGGLVTVTVSMSVEYPAPVREVAAEVRRQVVSRVGQLTGLEVVEVDIDVPTFITPRSRREPERRVR